MKTCNVCGKDVGGTHFETEVIGLGTVETCEACWLEGLQSFFNAQADEFNGKDKDGEGVLA